MGERDGIFLGGGGDCVVGEGRGGVVEETAGGGRDGGVGQYCFLHAQGWGLMMRDRRDSIFWALGPEDFTPLDDLHCMGSWRSGALIWMHDTQGRMLRTFFWFWISRIL